MDDGMGGMGVLATCVVFGQEWLDLLVRELDCEQEISQIGRCSWLTGLWKLWSRDNESFEIPNCSAYKYA
jgi:hypothetical protein